MSVLVLLFGLIVVKPVFLIFLLILPFLLLLKHYILHVERTSGKHALICVFVCLVML